jgi:hypothetical protein
MNQLQSISCLFKPLARKVLCNISVIKGHIYFLKIPFAGFPGKQLACVVTTLSTLLNKP